MPGHTCRLLQRAEAVDLSICCAQPCCTRVARGLLVAAYQLQQAAFLTGKTCCLNNMLGPSQHAHWKKHGFMQMPVLRTLCLVAPELLYRPQLLLCGAELKGLSGRRYFTVPRPLLLNVTGAVTGAQGPSYPHGNNITVTAQLTALTNSACCSYA